MTRVIAIEFFGVESMKRIDIRQLEKPAPSSARRATGLGGGVAITLDGIQFLARHAVPISRSGVVTQNGSEMAWLMQAPVHSKSGESQ